MKYISGSAEMIAKVLSIVAGEGSDDRWDHIIKNYPDLKWYIW